MSARSPRKNSPCQRYNRKTQQCENCDQSNNTVNFSKCIKYKEYKGNNILLELIWRVYQQVNCMDMECRDTYQTGHRLRLVYLYKELYAVHDTETRTIIRKQFIDTFGVYEGEYLNKWLAEEVRNQVPDEMLHELIEDYDVEVDAEIPLNPFEVLDVEEVKEIQSTYEIPSLPQKTPKRSKNKTKKVQQKPPKPTTENVPVLSRLSSAFDEEKYFIGRLIPSIDDIKTLEDAFDYTFQQAINVYGPFIDAYKGRYRNMLSTFRTYDKDIFLPLIYCVNISRHEHDKERISRLYTKYGNRVKLGFKNFDKLLSREREHTKLHDFIRIAMVTSNLFQAGLRGDEEVYTEMQEMGVMNKRQFIVSYKQLLESLNIMASVSGAGVRLGQNDLNDILRRLIDFFANKHNLGEFERELLLISITPSIFIQDIVWIQENAPDLEIN